MSITTGTNGTGTLVWAQSPGAIPCGTTNGGLLTDEVIDLSSYCGQTLYINAYDRYADSWDGTVYELRTGASGTGILLANNSGLSPDDGTDSDASSAFCDPQSAELEQSEAFAVPACPCTAPQALFTVVPDCGNAQYFIDVEVVSLGDASAVDISDGTVNYFTSTGLGTYTTGPFVYATNQLIDVQGTLYGGCDVASTVLTESCVCTNSPVFSHVVNTLDCSGLTYSMDVTVSSFGDGVSADIYIDNVLVQASASLAVSYTFSGYSLGSHDIRVEALGSGTVQCNEQQTITAFCNGADTWSLTAPSILNTCSSGDLSVANIDGPTDFGLFL